MRRYLNQYVVMTVAASSSILHASGTVLDTPSSPWQACGMKLIGMSESQERSPMYLASRVGNRTDVKYMKYLFSLIYVESRFRPTATSHVGAYGLGQMTDVAMVDAAKFCKLPVRKAMDVHDSREQVRYSSCYFSHLLKQTGGDYVRSLIIYNGGYRQLTRYETGQQMAQETANYVLQVKRAYEICSTPSVGD